MCSDIVGNESTETFEALQNWANPDVRDSLERTRTKLDICFENAKSGRLGALDRHWGFLQAGGLGPHKRGPLDPYRSKLLAVQGFFPRADAIHSAFCRVDPRRGNDADTLNERWVQLPGHSALHQFLSQEPQGAHGLRPEEFRDYRDAARGFILFTTLAHLHGNSATKPTELPAWIETPLLQLADRLEVPPILSGHFLTLENWTTNSVKGDWLGPDIHKTELIYPAFGHDQERVYHTIPACMAFKMRRVPALVADIVTGLKAMTDALYGHGSVSTLLDQIADQVDAITDALCGARLEFMRISSDPDSMTHVSPAVFIRHMQPLHQGIQVRDKAGRLQQRTGLSGLHFSLFHVIDLVIGRYQFGADGALAKMRYVEDAFPVPQREFVGALGGLTKGATLASLARSLPERSRLRQSFNRLIEAYAGDFGILPTHARKLLNFMHNGIQVQTAAEGHGSKTSKVTAENNHHAAMSMFRAMNEATGERATLSAVPTMLKVRKQVRAVDRLAHSGTIAFQVSDRSLAYSSSDSVKVILPRREEDAAGWFSAIGGEGPPISLSSLPRTSETGWTWPDLFEALGWDEIGVDRRVFCRFIESAMVPTGTTNQWTMVRDPRDFRARPSPSSKDPGKAAVHDLRVQHCTPISPRLYSACGYSPDELVVLVSKASDRFHHHGFERMMDRDLDHAWISVAPGAFFPKPPDEANLVIVATGTGIAPFVGLSHKLPENQHSVTLVHQSRSRELFLANMSHWLSLTDRCPNAEVLGYVSGNKGKTGQSCRYWIKGGKVQDILVTARHQKQCYYMTCDRFLERLRRTTRHDEQNLAYCCGRHQSAFSPLKAIIDRLGAQYKFTTDTQGGQSSTVHSSDYVLIGNSLVDLETIKPFHPGCGGTVDRVLAGYNAALGEQEADVTGQLDPEATPDVTALFNDLHPAPYNLKRCFDVQHDLEYLSFLDFVEAEAARGTILEEVAHHYAVAAINHPDRLDLVRAAVTIELRYLRDSNAYEKPSDESVHDLRKLVTLLPDKEPLYGEAMSELEIRT